MFDRPIIELVRAPRWEALVVQYYSDLELTKKAKKPRESRDELIKPPSTAAWLARRIPAHAFDASPIHKAK